MLNNTLFSNIRDAKMAYLDWTPEKIHYMWYTILRILNPFHHHINAMARYIFAKELITIALYSLTRMAKTSWVMFVPLRIHLISQRQ